MNHILIVDDSRLVRAMHSELLKRIGYANTHALASLSEASEYLGLSEGTTGLPVDVMLLDKNLPDGDGVDFIRTVRHSSHYNDLPIIMVTDTSDELALEVAFQAGATDFVHKSTNEIEFRARVSNALRFRQALEAVKRSDAEVQRLVRELSAARALEKAEF
jgi:DNA-binding response OmpR family regulator